MLRILLILAIQTTYASTDTSHNKIRHWNNNNFNRINRAFQQISTTSSKDDSVAIQLPSNNLHPRCLINASIPEEPKYFFYHDNELPIGILVSDRLTHKLASNVLKVFVEEILGYVNVTLVNMANPSQGFDPDTQFSYISSCTDPR